MSDAVKAVEQSSNRKVGKVSATYAAQQSCDDGCPFKNRGCYAESGLVAIHTRRLNAAACDMTPQAIADDEARAIDTLTGRLPMRLHVVGDCRTDGAARTVSSAAERYMARGNQSAWTYSHSWRDVARESWGKVSVLASVETLEDAGRAMARGYGAAIVVKEFESPTATVRDGIKVIPCPEQTGRAATCTECRLCWNADGLRDRRAIIAFAAHGPRKNSLRLDTAK